MAISSLGSLDLGKTINNIDTSITSAVKDTEESSFDSIFESALNMIKDTQDLTNQAEEEEMKYALGYDNTLELLVAQNKANTAVSYIVAVRDKVLDAYNEIMNMQF